MATASYGQVWRPKDRADEPTWTVVAVRGGEVSLSGPGPCRGMKTVTVAEFTESWERVEETKRGKRASR